MLATTIIVTTASTGRLEVSAPSGAGERDEGRSRDLPDGAGAPARAVEGDEPAQKGTDPEPGELARGEAQVEQDHRADGDARDQRAAKGRARRGLEAPVLGLHRAVAFHGWRSGRARRRPRPKTPTESYTDADGNVLTLRRELSAGTIAKIGEGPVAAATSQEDAWARREELLFERLATGWEIAGLPMTDQKMLIGRYRLADAATQEWVRETIALHLERYFPELET